MARPLSDARRAALLAAATQVFAEHGLGAPTALVSRAAKVSEGSLFTYFKTKDELITALYQEHRLDLATAILRDFPHRASLRGRLQHVFRRYVLWGVDHPEARRAMKHLTISNAIAPEVRAPSAVLFAEVDRLHQDAVAHDRLDLPHGMASAVLKAMAEMTMDLVEARPRQRAKYLEAGFRMLWGALTNKR